MMKAKSRILLLVGAAAVAGVVFLEVVHIAEATCVCKCSDYDFPPGGGATVRGVVVDGTDEVDTGAGCQTAFSYQYTGYFALDGCSNNTVGNAITTTGSSINITTGQGGSTISPSSFTVNGAGHTQLFSASGNLVDGTDDGVHATQVFFLHNFVVSCNSTIKIGIYHDPDAPCQ